MYLSVFNYCNFIINTFKIQLPFVTFSKVILPSQLSLCHQLRGRTSTTHLLRGDTPFTTQLVSSAPGYCSPLSEVKCDTILYDIIQYRILPYINMEFGRVVQAACVVCTRVVKSNDEALECDGCSKWQHIT